MLRSATLLSLASVLGLCAIAACSAPTVSSFGNGDKSKAGKDSPGTFGNGTDPSGTDPTVECVPNKANAEIPGDKCDNDGDGTADNPVVCDGNLAGDGSAADLAKTMGIPERRGAWLRPRFGEVHARLRPRRRAKSRAARRPPQVRQCPEAARRHAARRIEQRLRAGV